MPAAWWPDPAGFAYWRPGVVRERTLAAPTAALLHEAADLAARDVRLAARPVDHLVHDVQRALLADVAREAHVEVGVVAVGDHAGPQLAPLLDALDQHAVADAVRGFQVS